MQHDEGNLPCLPQLDEADVAQRLQRGGQQTRAHVDHRHLGVGTAHRVENLHLVRNRRDIHDLCHVGMKAFERAAWPFSIEGPGRYMAGAKIVEQRAGDGGLADATLVGTDKNDSWFNHGTPWMLDTDITGPSAVGTAHRPKHRAASTCRTSEGAGVQTETPVLKY